MIAITTSSSIRVNAARRAERKRFAELNDNRIGIFKFASGRPKSTGRPETDSDYKIEFLTAFTKAHSVHAGMKKMHEPRQNLSFLTNRPQTRQGLELRLYKVRPGPRLDPRAVHPGPAEGTATRAVTRPLGADP